MRRIDTIEDLRAERKRLTAYSRQLESDLQAEFRLLKEDLSPARLLFGGAKKDIRNHSESLVSIGAGQLAGFIARKVIFNRAGLIAKFVMPSLINRITSSIVERNRTKIMIMFGTIAAKFSRKKDKGDSEDNRNPEILS
jgi:hypothetical protein